MTLEMLNIILLNLSDAAFGLNPTYKLSSCAS